MMAVLLYPFSCSSRKYFRSFARDGCMKIILSWRLFCMIRGSRVCYHQANSNGDKMMRWIDKSRLFELARQGKRLTHVLAVIPLAFIFAFLAEFGAIPVLAVLVIQYGFPEDLLSMNQMPVTASGLWMALFL